MKLLITGGHHTSAIPIIKKIQKYHKDIDIIFVGHKHSLENDKNTTLEYRDIKELNVPFFNLITGKFYKKVNIINILKILVGFIQSFIILFKHKPDVVLSFGGYLSVPIVINSYILRIKILVHEQTLVLGLANKIGSKFANKILISWPQSAKYFDKSKTILTGIPIRPQIFIKESNEFIFNNKLPVIYITGGKTGSHIINMTIKKILPKILERYNVIHQCGDNSATQDYDNLFNYSKQFKNTKGKYYLRKFINTNEIGEVYNKSTLVISRSGAHTISELILLDKPSILIPISWSSQNEQFENASLLYKNNLAKIISEKDLNSESLLNNINDCIKNINKFKLKDESLKDLLNKDSTKIIIDEIYKTYKS